MFGVGTALGPQRRGALDGRARIHGHPLQRKSTCLVWWGADLIAPGSSSPVLHSRTPGHSCVRLSGSVAPPGGPGARWHRVVVQFTRRSWDLGLAIDGSEAFASGGKGACAEGVRPAIRRSRSRRKSYVRGIAAGFRRDDNCDMTADHVILFLILAAVALMVLGRFIGSRARSTVVIPFSGEVDPPAQWLPFVAEAARPRLSTLGWEWSVGEILGDQGTVIGRTSEVETADGAYRVRALVPEFTERRTFTEEEPLNVAVSLEAFQFRSNPAHRILLGRYPEPPAFKAKKKMIKSVKRHVGLLAA